MKDVWIGTSGWSYAGWRGSFYPPDVPQTNWLRYYATVFATTEINASFYRTPTLEAVKAWREQTPRGFLFAWRASKFITHWKRLGPTCDNSLALLQTRLARLRPKVGMVLFQLPANFGKKAERLEAFLNMLPRGRYAFEFRDDSWYSDDVYALLHKRNVALCISDHRDAPAPWEVVACVLARTWPDRRLPRQLSEQNTQAMGRLHPCIGVASGVRSLCISTMIRRPRRRRTRCGSSTFCDVEARNWPAILAFSQRVLAQAEREQFHITKKENPDGPVLKRHQKNGRSVRAHPARYLLRGTADREGVAADGGESIKQ